MPNIKINATPQRVQYVVGIPLQSEFPIPFPFLDNTDLNIYSNDSLLVRGADYTLEGVDTPSGGRLLLTTPAVADTRITIVGDMPVDRYSIYSPAISNLLGTDLNADFNRDIVMIKQLETVQNYMQLQYPPYTEISQEVTVTKDRWIPILPPGHSWRMNLANTKIETVALSGGAVAPITPGHIPMFINAAGDISDSLFYQQGTDLILPADPVADMAAVTKHYVDTAMPGGGSVTSVGFESTTLEVVGASPITGAGVFTVNTPDSLSGDNKIINGNFQVFQRGLNIGGISRIEVPRGVPTYTFDRWQAWARDNDCTVSQYTDPNRPSGSYQALIQRKPGQTGIDRIDFAQTLLRTSCRGAAGRRVTISFVIAGGTTFSAANGLVVGQLLSGSGDTDASIFGLFGTQTTEISEGLIADGSLRTYSFTSGILSANVSRLALNISWYPTGTAGVNDSVSISNVKVEIGTRATAFTREHYAETLAKCQPFYCKSYDQDDVPGTITAAGKVYAAGAYGAGQKVVPIVFPTTMRARPTITVYSGATGEAGKVDLNGIAVDGFSAFEGQSGFAIGTNDTLAANSFAAHYTADAELY